MHVRFWQRCICIVCGRNSIRKQVLINCSSISQRKLSLSHDWCRFARWTLGGGSSLQDARPTDPKMKTSLEQHKASDEVKATMVIWCQRSYSSRWNSDFTRTKLARGGNSGYAPTKPAQGDSSDLMPMKFARGYTGDKHRRCPQDISRRHQRSKLARKYNGDK
jgi:hypothetical protein